MSDLPQSWADCRLGDVVNYGVTQKCEPSDIPDDAWVLELEDIEKGTSRLVSRQTFAQRQSKSTKNIFEVGDVLYGKLRPYLNKVVIADQSGYCTTEILPLKVGPHLEARYLFYWLKHPKFLNYVEAESHGMNMPRLGTDTGKAAPFVLAPHAEQIRIADKLDAVLTRASACRDHLDRIPAILNRFRQSILATATSGKLTEDWRENDIDNWQQVRLADIADIQGGVTKDSKRQSVLDEDVPYLRVANVQRGYLDLTEVKTIRIPAAKIEGLLLEAGDILFNEGGDIDKLGRGWVWEGQIARCSFQNHVFRARLYDKKNQPKYISWWGNFRGLDYFLRSGKQTTNLASINKSMLSSLPIRLPPPEEQIEIVRRVESLFAYADRLEARHVTVRTQVDNLTSATLAKAFRGELVPQNPDDEPASELLQRIRDTPIKSIPKARIQPISRPETEVPMVTLDKSSPKYLTSLLLLSKDRKLEAKVLWQESGLSIPDFYEQLKSEIDCGLLREVKFDSWSILEAI